MLTFQLWLHGNTLMGTMPFNTKEEALTELRIHANNLGYKRLPNGSCVCEIESDYNERMIEHNRNTSIPGSCSTDW